MSPVLASCVLAPVLRCQQRGHELCDVEEKPVCGTKAIFLLHTGRGRKNEGGQLSHAGLRSGVLHAADSGIAPAVEL